VEHDPLVFDFLRSLDIFVLTSKYEGFGLVLLEAMQVGLPIVASDIAPIREVLGEDFPNLCKVGDEDEFALKIMQLKEISKKIDSLALQNLRLKRFTPQIMNEKIDEIYLKIFK
jgi:glycosyltransferase involved in cell wall biosynthesis